MDDDGDTCGLQPVEGILVDGEGVAPADGSGGILMDGLQPQLHPHGLDPVEPSQERHHLIGQAVRPGTDGEAHDLLRLHGRFV